MKSQLTYTIVISDPIPIPSAEPVPNGDRRMFSPLSTTLIGGAHDAVLVDPPMTGEQGEAVATRIMESGKNLTDIFITHGHGDHWFTAGMLAERFGARVVASAGTIQQMHRNVAIREQFWDRLFPGMIPDAPVTAVTPPGGRFTLEDHPLLIVEAGHSDTDDSTVLHVPDLGLVVAGDVLYNGVHQFLVESAGSGIDAWRKAIDVVAALEPNYIVTGHKNKALDDDATRVVAQTRHYLDAAEELLRWEDTALGFFHGMLEAFPGLLNPGAIWNSATALYS
jgi:glyoxylase-like metal-dependent hydrolase (beta-lactamase superfamily II)